MNLLARIEMSKREIAKHVDSTERSLSNFSGSHAESRNVPREAVDMFDWPAWDSWDAWSARHKSR